MKFSFLKFTRGAAAATAVAGLFLSAAAPADAAKYVAKIGHLESPQQSRNVLLTKVAELVKQRTGGDVEFQIFPSSQLGGQRQMTEGVQMGSLECTISPAAFLGGFNPLVSILDIPYLYPQDDQQAQKIRSGEFGQALLKSFDSRGVKAILLWPNGRKNFTSSKPLDKISDFKGQKFRVMDSKILIEQFNALGASAIALPFAELYTALQTGVVDGEENPLDTIKNMKYFEVQKNLVVSEHGLMEDLVLFNPIWWNALPDKYKTVIVDTFKEVIPELLAHKAAAVASALEEIKAHGMNVRVASSEEKAELRKVMYPRARDAYLEKAGDEGKALIKVYEKAYSEAVSK